MTGLGIFIALFSGGGSTMTDGMQVPLVFQLIIGIGLFVVILSPFIVLWWLTRPSQPGQNEYGPNPHEVPQ